MKNEVKRYTLNLVVGGKYIPFASSTIENIDRLSTNFNDLFELINHLELYAELDFLVQNLAITYKANRRTKELPLLFNSYRELVDNDKLVNKLVLLLSKYETVSQLQLNKLNNRFLKDLLYSMLEQVSFNDYKYRLNIINNHLLNEYKLKRDLIIFLEEHMKKKGKTFLEQKKDDEKNYFEVNQCLNNMDIKYKSNRNPKKQEQFVDTGDLFLDTLIENKDYETISQLYDIDQLESLGVKNIFDGNHEVTKQKGKSR